MFPLIQVGNVVLIECPQRWYLGRVKERGNVNCTLEDVATIHQIGDLGRFMDGYITQTTEVTPMPGLKDINYAAIHGVDLMDEEKLVRLRVRTNIPENDRQL